MQYDVLCPRHIVFGWGRVQELPRHVASFGDRAFVISGSRTLESNGTLGAIQEKLKFSGIQTVPLTGVSHEPEVDDVDRTTAELMSHQPCETDCIIGIGGGAALDLAKAVAALSTNSDGQSVKEYLEGVGSGLPISRAPLPMIAIPTTAGTGTEATKNAVISSYDPKFKKSLRSNQMVPAVALVDPQLTCSLPPAQTAASGMDAITQLIESYISCRAQPIPQALAIDGLRRAMPAMLTAYRDGMNQDARTAMAHAAMLSGMALANSGLGMAHGVAAALGVHARVPHGVACAMMLPIALETNKAVASDKLEMLARETLPDCPTSPEAAVEAFVQTIKNMNTEMNVPSSLTELGVTREQLTDIVQSSRGNSMSGNPRPLEDSELTEILESCL